MSDNSQWMALRKLMLEITRDTGEVRPETILSCLDMIVRFQSASLIRWQVARPGNVSGLKLRCPIQYFYKGKDCWEQYRRDSQPVHQMLEAILSRSDQQHLPSALSDLQTGGSLSRLYVYRSCAVGLMADPDEQHMDMAALALQDVNPRMLERSVSWLDGLLPAIAASISRKFLPSDYLGDFPAHNLSRRERDIYQRLIQGASTREIARNCGISTRTVNFHLQNVYRKLKVQNRCQALVAASNIGTPPADSRG